MDADWGTAKRIAQSVSANSRPLITDNKTMDYRTKKQSAKRRAQSDNKKTDGKQQTTSTEERVGGEN